MDINKFIELYQDNLMQHQTTILKLLGSKPFILIKAEIKIQDEIRTAIFKFRVSDFPLTADTFAEIHILF